MPYVITTGTPWGRNLGARDKYAVTSRIAVATLDEARHAAWMATDLADTDQGRFRTAIAHFPADGGTIGPLPDGTVIEVRRELVTPTRRLP